MKIRFWTFPYWKGQHQPVTKQEGGEHGVDWIELLASVMGMVAYLLVTAKKRTGLAMDFGVSVTWIAWGFLYAHYFVAGVCIFYSAVAIHAWFKWKKSKKG